MPEWLRQSPYAQQEPAAPTASPSMNGAYGQYVQYGQPAAPSTPSAQQGMFSMQSLINEDALPEWLRAVSVSGGLTPPAQPAPPAAPAWGGAPQQGYSAFGQPQGPAFGGPAQNTPASALFDQSAFPAWLQQAAQGQDIDARPTYQQMQPVNGQYAQPGYPQAYPQIAPLALPAPETNAFPGIERAGTFGASAGAGVSGQSLLDPSSLPGWLSGNLNSGNDRQAYDGLQRAPGGAMSAQSLIDEQALPSWLRAQPATPPAASYPQVGAFGSAGGASAAMASDEGLPAWLRPGAAAGAPAYGAPAAGASAQPWTNAMSLPGAPAPQSQAPGMGASVNAALPASQFVDESALPEWLRQQGAQPLAPAQPAPAYPALEAPRPASAAPAPDAGAATFSAADLVDPSALPEWVRGDAAPEPTFSSSAGWTSQRPAVPSMPKYGPGGVVPPPAVGYSGDLADERGAAGGWPAQPGAQRPIQRDQQTNSAYPARPSALPGQWGGAEEPGRGAGYDGYPEFGAERGAAVGYDGLDGPDAGFGAVDDGDAFGGAYATAAPPSRGRQPAPALPPTDLPPWLRDPNAPNPPASRGAAQPPRGAAQPPRGAPARAPMAPSGDGYAGAPGARGGAPQGRQPTPYDEAFDSVDWLAQDDLAQGGWDDPRYDRQYSDSFDAQPDWQSGWDAANRRANAAPNYPQNYPQPNAHRARQANPGNEPPQRRGWRRFFGGR